ncbi:spore germination protein [Alkalihalobacillus oceani]|uniref:spore germination protein n=1 Tax=Halalkalibacter oceani TaxID=1653776 RepID=UPI00203A82D8|nr:spore germination protein [Halalkalibacter oceani]MCM3762255.1 spore germination protein [Halalkalibacter oceani]
MYRLRKGIKRKPVQQQHENEPFDTSLSKNIQTLKELYSYKVNQDFAVREFTIKHSGRQAALLYYQSAVDPGKLAKSIIEPLLQFEGEAVESIVTLDNISEGFDTEDAITSINNGYAVLFIDGESKAYLFNVSDFKHRNIEKTQNENLIKGPKEAFAESSLVNISMLRKRIHDKDFITETVSVGKRLKADVSILYIKDIANPEIIKEVKQRIGKIKSDSVRSVELLEQYIEDRPYSLIPTILYSERPDRAAAYLEDGYVVLLMENSSSCLVLPVTFWSFFHSAEDRYLRLLFGNFSRAVRILAFFITLLISALYISLVNYHDEMIPPDLLLAIAATREKVPFPVIIEVLIMEVAFELIREAGLRIPNPLGPTIGIVGALILGQAAVEANIISPVIVIVVALSGLSSFAIADISFNYTIRLSRFIFIFCAAAFGMFGLVGCYVLWTIYLCSITSFGVPFLAPLAPHFTSAGDTIFRRNIRNEIWRPAFLKLKDMQKNQKDT